MLYHAGLLLLLLSSAALNTWWCISFWRSRARRAKGKCASELRVVLSWNCLGYAFPWKYTEIVCVLWQLHLYVRDTITPNSWTQLGFGGNFVVVVVVVWFMCLF